MFSITQTEYKAMIDVCMGGRVAETLSKYSLHEPSYFYQLFRTVYGEGGLTSGCSSDLQKATRTATQMVKVRSVVAK
jgi:ATP-dependent metalloprotease